MESVNNNKKSKIFSIIISLIVLFFPIIKIIKINQLLKKAEKIDKNDWYSKTRKRNLLIGFIVSIPLIISVLLSTYILYKDPNMFKHLSEAKLQMEKFEIFQSVGSAYKAFFNPATFSRLVAMCNIVAIGSVLTLVLGLIVSKTMALLKDTKILVNQLKRHGIFDKEDSSRIALATPRGLLIDVSGSSARHIKDMDSLWMALNIKVNDFIEDSDKRSLVFFQKKYELKKSYMYKAQDIAKLLEK